MQTNTSTKINLRKAKYKSFSLNLYDTKAKSSFNVSFSAFNHYFPLCFVHFLPFTLSSCSPVVEPVKGKLLLEFELDKIGLRYGAEHYPHSTSVISTTLFMLNKILYKGTTYKTVKYITRRPFKIHIMTYLTPGNQKTFFFFFKYFLTISNGVLFHLTFYA